MNKDSRNGVQSGGGKRSDGPGYPNQRASKE